MNHEHNLYFVFFKKRFSQQSFKLLIHFYILLNMIGSPITLYFTINVLLISVPSYTPAYTMKGKDKGV